MKAYQHFCAPNDTNGNPRRLWVIYTLVETDPEPGMEYPGATVTQTDVYEEGYRGWPRPLNQNHMAQLPTIGVSATVYKALVNHAKCGFDSTYHAD